MSTIRDDRCVRKPAGACIPGNMGICAVFAEHTIHFWRRYALDKEGNVATAANARRPNTLLDGDWVTYCSNMGV